MAITVIGGLLVSTLLTLVVIPVVYTLLDRRSDAMYRERGERKHAAVIDAGQDGAAGAATVTLAELSLKRPVTAVMLFVSMTVIGLIAAFRLPLEELPDIQFPFMLVNHAVSGLDAGGSRAHDHASGRGSVVDADRHRAHEFGHRAPTACRSFMQFKWGQDTAVKAVEARGKIDAIRADLPSDLHALSGAEIFRDRRQPVLNLRISVRSRSDQCL